MNPVTVGFLSQVERQRHAREIRELQRLNQAVSHRRERLPAHRRASRRIVQGIARVLLGAGRRLYTWSAAADYQAPEPA